MINRVIMLAAIAILAGAALIGCGHGKSEGLKITGSDTMLTLTGHWAEAFQEENPGIDLSVTGGGSGGGIAALMQKTTDIAMASRMAKDSEKADGEKNGVKPVEYIVAYDGLAIMVNKNFPKDEITFEQLKAIFGDKDITNWKQVPGFEDVDKALATYGRDSSSGTFDFFREEILGKDGKYRDDTLLGREQGNAQILDKVSTTDGSIGYCGLGYVESRKNDVKVLKVKKGSAPAYDPWAREYALCRPLLFYTNGEPTGAMKKFIEFAKSKEGQEIVEKEGFIPVAKRQ
jgi:phosphate transport system substrate-binding protein